MSRCGTMEAFWLKSHHSAGGLADNNFKTNINKTRSWERMDLDIRILTFSTQYKSIFAVCLVSVSPATQI